MGFGEKTGVQSNPQRVLDLDRTYEDIIGPAVTVAGLECVKPMYENVLEADLEIADLLTSILQPVHS